jgi:transketolase
VPLERVGVNDTFTESGPYDELLDKYGLTTDGVIAAIKKAIARKQAESLRTDNSQAAATQTA